VVGVPLPLISYGGTAILTVMFGFGLMMSVYTSTGSRPGAGGAMRQQAPPSEIQL
jgi:rod shape determining protein RodA